MGRPSHPGPRPEPLEFPFAEARAARASADEAADALALLRTIHEDAWQHVEDGQFSGRTADALRDRSRELLGAVDQHVDALRRQAGAIEDDIAEAERRIRIREAAIQDWWGAYRRWADWEPPPEVCPPTSSQTTIGPRRAR